MTDDLATTSTRTQPAGPEAVPAKNAALWDLQSVRADRAQRAAPSVTQLIGRCVRKFNGKVAGSGLRLVVAHIQADPPVLNEIALAVRGDDDTTYPGVIRLRNDGLANLVIDQQLESGMRLLEQFDFTRTTEQQIDEMLLIFVSEAQRS